MIYVSASLDNAQARNATRRARKLPPEIVKQDWDAMHKRMHNQFKKDVRQRLP